MCPQGDTGEDNGQQIISPFWTSFMFLEYFMYTPYNKLKIATLIQSMLSNTSQTTLVQITHVFCCFILHKLRLCHFDSCKCLTCYMMYIY